MPDLSHSVLGSSHRRSENKHAHWRKLAYLAALCGPSTAAAWRPGVSQNDTWLATPSRHQVARVPVIGTSPHIAGNLGAPQNLRRQLQATPASPATDYSQEPEAGDSAYQYVSEAGGDQLYSTSNPQLSDFLQGNEGDCYFAASLAATIMSDRDFIKSGLLAKGTGTTGNQFQARFFYKGQTEWYGLDDRFPETSFGTRLGYQQPIVNGKAVAGPALWEKGWVKFSDAHPDVLGKGVKGYPAINGGRGIEALAAITNQTTSYLNPTDGQLLQKLSPVNTGKVNALFAFVTANLVSTLPDYSSGCSCAKLSDGTVVTDNGDGVIKIKPPQGAEISLVDDHMYAVAAVFLNNQTARLFNPWGSNPGASGAVVDIAATTLAQVGSYGVIADSTKGDEHHGLSAGAIGGIVGGAIGAVAILTALGFWLRHRKKRSRVAHTVPAPNHGRDGRGPAPQGHVVHWPRTGVPAFDIAPDLLPPGPLPHETYRSYPANFGAMDV